MSLKVKIKRLSAKSILPTYSKPGDAGMDLTAVKIKKNFDSIRDEYTKVVVDSGIAVEIPNGYVGLIFPRSSIQSTGLRLTNSVGVIDSQYRGSIKAYFDILDPTLQYYEIGERFAQLIILPYPQIEFEEVEELSETERGTGGFGSTNVERNIINGNGDNR